MEIIMKIKEGKITLIASAAFALVYIISFWLGYIAAYTSAGAAAVYISSLYKDIYSSLLPSVAVMLMFITYTKKGLRSALLRAPVYSASVILYKLPSLILLYAYGGYEITDVIILSVLYALLDFIILLLIYLLLFLIMLFVIKRFARTSCKRGFDIKDTLNETEPLSLTSPLAVGMLAVNASIFLYALVNEIISTVQFLSKYSDSFTAPELIEMLFNYVFILGMLILSQILCFAVKNLFSKEQRQ